jgi:hypothetical protein
LIVALTKLSRLFVFNFYLFDINQNVAYFKMAAHVHPIGADLIAAILKANSMPAPPAPTTYDILRLPLYKTYAEHTANHLAVQKEINSTRRPCTCVGRTDAIAREFTLLVV